MRRRCADHLNFRISARPLGAAFVPSEEEQTYATLHGLDHAQLAGRRTKIAQLKDPADGGRGSAIGQEQTSTDGAVPD